MTVKKAQGFWLLGVGCAIILFDAVVKALTVRYIPPMSLSSPYYPYGGIGVFKNFLGIEFSLSHTTNVGAAWGIFANYQALLLVIRILLILGIVGLLLFRASTFSTRLPLVFITAGALGNVLDYFIYGHVVDMFHAVLWGYDFPVFNVADSCISIGVMLLFWFSFSKNESAIEPC